MTTPIPSVPPKSRRRRASSCSMGVAAAAAIAAQLQEYEENTRRAMTPTNPASETKGSTYMHDEFSQSQSTSFMHQFPTFENEIEKVKKKFSNRNQRGRRLHSRARFNTGRRKIGLGNSEVTVQCHAAEELCTFVPSSVKSRALQYRLSHEKIQVIEAEICRSFQLQVVWPEP